MGLHSLTQSVCDHCKAHSETIPTGDSLEAGRVLLSRHWNVISFDFYGNLGYFCPKPECQKEAAKQSYREDV